MKVTMYTTPICPYCVRAKALLDKKGIEVEERDITTDPKLFKEMLERSGGRKTVPQIFIGDYHVGGSDDLYQLEKSGELDQVLKQHG
jgi:glutaredoxin 3